MVGILSNFSLSDETETDDEIDDIDDEVLADSFVIDLLAGVRWK